MTLTVLVPNRNSRQASVLQREAFFLPLIPPLVGDEVGLG